MQDHVRMETDRVGFCREHYKKMFAYGETLGNALIIETRLKFLMKEMKKEFQHYAPVNKVGLKDKLKKDVSATRDSNSVSR
jgi:hypothetical protein